MRILALRGRNLASLSEDFEIDFKAPPLADAGIFAITGDTGAGKSTILDAMCVALFGEFPRSDVTTSEKITDAAGHELTVKDARNILRRGAAEGYAEVDFIGQDGVEYRARWAVRRARNSPSGRLQAAERTLDRLDGTGNVATGIDAVHDAVVERTGLKFDQFRRTVLLAQGDFDAFLLASEKDRADLLEKLTGTDLYSRISKAAFDEKARRETEIAGIESKASGVAVLAADERENLLAAIETAKEQAASLENALQSARVAHAFAEAALKQQGEIEAAEIALSNAGQALADNAALVQDADTLAALQPVASAFEQMRSLTRAIEGITRAHADWLSKQSGAQEEAAAAREDVLKAKAAVADAEAEEVTWRPEWEKATRLDIELHLAAESERKSKQAADRESATLANYDNALIQRAAVLATSLPKSATLDVVVAWTTARIAEVSEEARQLDADLRDLRPRLVKTDVSDLHRRDAAFERVETQLKGLRKLSLAVAEARAKYDSAAQAVATSQHNVAAAKTANEFAQQRLRDAERALADASPLGAMADVALSEHVEHMRAMLEANEPCPVCGSRDHPYGHAGDATLALVQAAKDRRDVAKTELAAAETAARRSYEAEARAHSAAERMQHQLVEAREQLEAAVEEEKAASHEALSAAIALGVEGVSPEEVAAPIAQKRAEIGREIASARELAVEADLKSKRHSELTAESARLAELAKLIERREPLVERLEAIIGDHEARATSKRELAERRSELLGGEATEGHRSKILNRLVAAKRWLGDAETRLAATAEAEQRIEGEITKLAAAGTAYSAQHREAEASYTDRLRETGIAADRATALLERPAADRSWIAERAQKLRDAVRAATELAATRRADLMRHLAGASLPDGAGMTRLATELAHAEDELKTVRDVLAASRQKLASDDEGRARLAAIAADIEARKSELRIWHEVDDTIGSADGAKFRRIAQGVTLGHLVALANHQLANLNPRYQLRRAPNADLVLEIVDRDMGDEVRSPRSLSGGERFLVSLALALALAGLEGNRAFVDTLFIDEGFGTLDRETLDMAIDALEALQGQGRQVGVITHVASMIDRIAVQIRVEKRGGGRSVVRIADGFTAPGGTG